MSRSCVLVCLVFVACNASPKGPDTLTLLADKRTLLTDGQDQASITVTVSNANGSALPSDVAVTVTASKGSLGGTSGVTTQQLTLTNGTAATTYKCVPQEDVTITLSALASKGSASGSVQIICGAGSGTMGSTGSTGATGATGGTGATGNTGMMDNAGPLSGAAFEPGTDFEGKIRIKGSIGPDHIVLGFSFFDSQGRAVTDGLPVSFTLSPNVSEHVYVTPAETTTVGGRASVLLYAGGQAETVTVTATATSNGVTVSATSWAIAIVGGVPEYSHMSISCEPDGLEVAGLALDGESSKCYVRLADRFSNRVDVGTQVNMRTEAGSIENTMAIDPGTGYATVHLESASPRPRKFLVKYDGATGATAQGPSGHIEAVKELPPLPFAGSYDNTPNHAYGVRLSPLGTYIPNFWEAEADPADRDLWATRDLIRTRGVVTFIAITQGEESFADVNGNKIYDVGEPYIDLPEPFVDKNDNGVQDTCLINGAIPAGMTAEDFYACNEDFIDLDGDGLWTPGNDHWDNYTLIWKAMHVTWYGNLSPSLSPVALYGPTGSVAMLDVWTEENILDMDPLLWPSDVSTAFTPNPFVYAPAASGPMVPVSLQVEWGDLNGNCEPRGDADRPTVKSESSLSFLAAKVAMQPFDCYAIVSVTDTSTTPTSGAGTIDITVDDPVLDLTTELGWGFRITQP